MTWKRNDNIKFVNPYNFISLGNKSYKKFNALEIRTKNDKITGYIQCELETKTPIFIPNVTNDKVFYSKGEEHKSYDFFSYEDLTNKTLHADEFNEPIIPGSSIRGVIRNVYETLTNSCMSVIDDEKPLYKRLPDPGQAGLIIRDGERISLYKSRRVMVKYKECKLDDDNLGKYGVDINKYSYGEKVWIEEGKKYKNKNYMPNVCKRIKKEKFDGGKECYVITGGSFIKKHHFTVILKENITKLDVLNENDIKRLENVLDLYLDKTINKNIKDKEEPPLKGYKELLEKFEKGEVNEIPVFYKKINGIYYISPACITKEVYNNTIGTIIKENGNYNPCNNIESLCECCNLFGMVGEENNKFEYVNSNSSRIRFEDAKLVLNEGKEIKDIFLNKVTLKELASPKVSATEFYLFKPELKEAADIWTYDYAAKWERSGRKKAISGYKPKIRGRKFFWHHWYQGEFDITKLEDKQQTKRNVTIRPIKSNIKFEFKVFFDRITIDELRKLVWVLNLGSNENLNMHKIGMAKPLGLGSVKIKIKDVIKREIKLKSKDLIYTTIPIFDELKISEDGVDIFGDSIQLKELKKITSFEPIGNIAYPLGVNNVDLKKARNNEKKKKNATASHQWFSGNKQVRGKGTNPIIELPLPSILEDISLPKYENN